MKRHLAVCVVMTMLALGCFGQNQKVPFLQIEHGKALSPQQGWSQSVDGINPAIANASPESLFEPGFRRSSTAKMQSPIRDRVIDGKFLTANGSSVAMTVLDYATTRHCLALHECIEGNPMMPTSLGGMIAVGVLSDGTIAAYSYLLKKRHFRTAWAMAPVANAGLHLWGMRVGLKSW